MLSLPSRTFGRTQRSLPLLWWELTAAAIAGPGIDGLLQHAAESGAAAILLPADVPMPSLGRLGEAAVLADWLVLIGMSAEDVDRRSGDPLAERLAALGLRRCEGVMLQGVGSGQIKTGRPFHRLMQLRDRGLLDLFLLDTDDLAEAEWMVANTPAHGVCLPFGLLDQTASFRILASASELGTAIIAKPPREPRWSPPEPVSDEMDLAFVVGEPAVASAIHPLPADDAEVDRNLNAVCHPMSEGDRARWWELYQAAVPAPPKPPRHLPPEFA